jgi:hypothetical protein
MKFADPTKLDRKSGEWRDLQFHFRRKGTARRDTNPNYCEARTSSRYIPSTTLRVSSSDRVLSMT